MVAAPASLRASWRRSSTTRWRAVISSRTLRCVAARSAVPGWARSTSSSERMRVSGLRRSWEASATKRRWRPVASWRRSSMAFIVRPRRAISSSPPGWGTRERRSVPPMLATCARMASTGRRVRPTRVQMSAASRAATAGMTRLRLVARIRVLSSTSSSGPATWSTMAPSPLPTRRDRSRKAFAPRRGRSTVRRASVCPAGGGLPIAAAPATLGLEASTWPSEVTIWTTTSSVPVRVRGTRPLVTRVPRSSACCRMVSSRFSVSSRWAMTRPMPVVTSTAITARAASAVMRNRRVPTTRRVRRPGRGSAAIVGDAVASTPDGLDGATVVRLVDLATQATDVHLDNIGVAVEVLLPHPGEDLVLGQDLAGAPDEELQHLELARGQGELVGVAPGAPFGGVDAQVPDDHRGGIAAGGPAQQGPDPGDQHRKRERLGEVVVRAGVEGLGLVEVAILGGEHQDRRPVARLTQVGTDLVAVAAGQHDVQQQQVVGALGGQPQPVVNVIGNLDGEPFRLQAAHDGCGDLPVVLDQKQLHGDLSSSSVATARGRARGAVGVLSPGGSGRWREPHADDFTTTVAAPPPTGARRLLAGVGDVVYGAGSRRTIHAWVTTARRLANTMGTWTAQQEHDREHPHAERAACRSHRHRKGRGVDGR